LDDPKKRTKAVIEDEPDDLALQVAQLQATVEALLKDKTQSGGISEDRLEAILGRVAQMSADAAERAANPSNKTHPGISVYSNPEGERANPRPPLKCQMFWAGYLIDTDTTTAEEIDLFNQAKPGLFTVTRTDGSPLQLEVSGTSDAAGNLSRLEFMFPTKENRETLPSMTGMLRQAYKIKTPEQLELERLRKEVEELRAVHA